MKKYMFEVNDVFVEVDGRNVLGEGEIKKFIVERGGGKCDDYGILERDMSMDEFWELLLKGDKIECIDEELCERGDDYVELRVVEVKL